MNPKTTLKIMFKEPLSTSNPKPGIPSTGPLQRSKVPSSLAYLNSEEEMEKEVKKEK